MAVLAVSDANQFLLTVAATLAALATIVASVRVLARIKVLAVLGRALVGDPARRYLTAEVNERLAAVEAHQAAQNGDLREAVEANTATLEALRSEIRKP